MHKKVMVVGGGIAGIQASLDLAEMGIEVYLVEKNPSIGGRMAQLDKTFPTNDCAMCILSPKLVQTGSHPNINILANSEVQKIEGQAPNFKVSVTKYARFVDESKCTGCGVCMSKCPVKIPDEYNKGLSKTKNIRIPFPQAVPAIPIMSKETCLYHQRGTCRICEKSCEQKAIDFQQKDKDLELEVGSIILALGAAEFNARLKGDYGYKAYSNVISSIELERLLSASGPTQGHLRRPSDEKEPNRIAFLQCVGSRDKQVNNEYCSSICCMQAAKDTTIIAEHLKDVKSTIFFMDIRAFGKDFDKFVDRTKEEYGARFIRARIAEVAVNSTNENLKIRYDLGKGKLNEEEFDMVVLSIGLAPDDDVIKLLKKLKIKLNPVRNGISNWVNEMKFLNTDPFKPVATSRPGIFVCGVLSGPKDIPETVMQASGAASAASGMLVGLPKREIKLEYPVEENIIGEPTRIGVFVCRCGINIASVVDVPNVVEYAKSLPGVAYAEELLFSCSQDSQKLINEKIREKRLNRVIVSACTPRTHEPLFQGTLQGSGLNPYLFEFANIREQCSWVHQKEPERATEKAKDIIRMAVAKASILEPLSKMTLDMKRCALVIGAGVSGMTAASELSQHGFQVYLVEKGAQLGGNFQKVHYTIDGIETRQFLNSLIEKVKNDKRIKVFTNANIKEVAGYVGNFKTKIAKSIEQRVESVEQKAKSEDIEIEHGVVIVATGAKEYETKKYMHGEDERVITQRELEDMIIKKDVSLKQAKSIVMIQCVNSRDEEHPYCSRVCCSEAVKNSLKIKELNPDASIFVLYRDIRTYGLKELAYKKARDSGILFINYEKEAEPKVEGQNGRLLVKVNEPILNKEIELGADLLILSVAVVAHPENRELSQFLKVPLNQDGFFLEAHVKLRPVDFATDGVFVAGLAHYPKDVSESIAQAKAAAARAMTLLSKEKIEAEGKVAQVRNERCIGCGLCVSVCPFKAIEMDEALRVAVVNEALCKGCGACTASCRPAAIDLKGFRDEQVLAMLNAL
jgi:heterodisulfide reductase subunit A